MPDQEWIDQVNQWAAVRRELRAAQAHLAKGGMNKSTDRGNYFFNILIAIDQLGNAFLAGDPDETISSRIGKKKLLDDLNLVAKALDMILDFLDPNHSIDAIEPDEGVTIDELRERVNSDPTIDWSGVPGKAYEAWRREDFDGESQ